MSAYPSAPPEPGISIDISDDDLIEIRITEEEGTIFSGWLKPDDAMEITRRIQLAVSFVQTRARRRATESRNRE